MDHQQLERFLDAAKESRLSVPALRRMDNEIQQQQQQQQQQHGLLRYSLQGGGAQRHPHPHPQHQQQRPIPRQQRPIQQVAQQHQRQRGRDYYYSALPHPVFDDKQLEQAFPMSAAATSYGEMLETCRTDSDVQRDVACQTDIMGVQNDILSVDDTVELIRRYMITQLRADKIWK